MKTPPLPPCLLFFFLLLLSTDLLAQFEKAEKALSTGDCTGAQTIYVQYRNDKKLAAPARLGLARIYSEPGCPFYQPDTAYAYLAATYEAYRALDKNEREKIEKRGYSPRVYSQTRDRILDTLYTLAKNRGEVAALDQFLNDHPVMRRGFADEVTAERNRLALRQAMNEGTLQALDDFDRQYGESFRERNYDWRDTLAKAQLNSWVREQGWDKFAEFSRRFPGNTYAGDRATQRFLRLRQSGGGAKPYEQFAQTYGSSAWAAIARDSAAAVGRREAAFRERINALYAILRDSTAATEWAAADAAFADLLTAGRLRPEQMESYFTAIPGKRLPKTQEVYRARAGNELEALRTFQKTFPYYHDPAGLAAAIRERQAAVDKERKENLDNTLKVLKNDALADNWPDADRRLQGMYQVLPPDTGSQEAFIKSLKTVPVTRIPRTLTDVRRDFMRANDVATFDKHFPNYKAEDFAVAPAKPGPTPNKPSPTPTPAQANERVREFEDLQSEIRNLLWNREWQSAVSVVQLYDKKLGKNKYYRELLDVLTRAEPDVTPELLGGEQVNTQAGEYWPVLSADGRMLYYCKYDGPNRMETIRAARKNGDRWEDLGEVEDFRDDDKHVAPLYLTPDNNHFYIFRNGDLCLSRRTAGGWSPLEELPATINGKSWQCVPTLSADGQVMIFEARGDNYSDDIDLFVSFRDAAGNWSTPLALEAPIRTGVRERSPFLHPDNKTLYYSTEGRGGLGGMDVYKTTRLDDSWLKWSEPEHLGRSVNTPGDDFGYKITVDGQSAYYAADVRGSTAENLFIVTLPEAARPEPVTLVEVDLVGGDGKPLGGEVLVEDLESGEVVARVVPDTLTGRALITLPNGGLYGLAFANGDRLPLTQNIDLRKVDSSQVIQRRVVLKTEEEMAKSGENYRLENVFFDFDKSELKPESYSEIGRLANYLRDNPDIKAEIQGHTDDRGDDAYNKNLSQARAEAVRRELIRLGIAADRLQATGFGESKPLVANDMEQHRARNRRVEVRMR